MLPRLFPRVDERRCITCGDCLRCCPTACLRIVHSAPAVTVASACISCGVCDVVCPTRAISLVPLKW